MIIYTVVGNWKICSLLKDVPITYVNNQVQKIVDEEERMMLARSKRLDAMFAKIEEEDALNV